MDAECVGVVGLGTPGAGDRGSCVRCARLYGGGRRTVDEIEGRRGSPGDRASDRRNSSWTVLILIPETGSGPCQSLYLRLRQRWKACTPVRSWSRA